MKEDPAENEFSIVLENLLQSIGLLISQSEMYERVLPPDNYPARAAVAVLGELARQVMSEGQTLADALAPSAALNHPFSPRELEVLELAARGMTNKEIAYRLRISERTVQFHMNSIFNKTGTSTRTEAVALATRSRWIPVDKTS